MGQRLLLVDSDRSFLKEQQVSLEAAFDLDVTGTTDGVIQRLESGAYAGVLICVEVADHKGYALCSTIRKNANLDAVKIILISAKATEEEYRRHQSLKGRADLYLRKPIAPSALVAALLPLVPGRALDPDNPLGELVDTELGDDWLDNLKSSLDAVSPAAETVGGYSVRPAAPPPEAAPDSGRLEALEAQVAALQTELRTKDQLLTATEQQLRGAEAESQQIQRQLSSVTLNLDELEQSSRAAEAAQTRLAETEAALRQLEEVRGREGEGAEALRAQLREALTERAELIQQVETLNHQVSEKAQRAIELLKDRDRLLHDNMDLEAQRGRAQELEQVLAAKEQALAAKEAALVGATQELAAARVAQEQLHATIEGFVEQHARLDGLHQSALLEVAGHKERAHTLQMEMAGLEATLRGQGRDLAEVADQLRQREADLTTSQAALEASQATLAEREGQLLAWEELLQQQREEGARLSGELDSLRQAFDEAKIQHEGERLELMNGLDQKEAELVRLNEALAEQAKAQVDLEREKQAVHGQLAEHRDRLQNLDGLLNDIQDQLRRGSDLVRG
jgi:DNA-binding response OmpR family regulator